MNEQQLADRFAEQLDRLLAGQPAAEAADLNGLNDMLQLSRQLSQVQFQARPAAQAAFQAQLANWFGAEAAAGAASTVLGLPKGWLMLFTALMVATGVGVGLWLALVNAVPSPEQPLPAIEATITPRPEPTATSTPAATASPAPSSTATAAPTKVTPEVTTSVGDTLPPVVTSSVGDMLPTATPTATPNPTITPTITLTRASSSTGDNDNGQETPDEEDSRPGDGNDQDRGHGNDPDRVDEDNPGQSSGPGGGDDNRGGGNNKKGGK